MNLSSRIFKLLELSNRYNCLIKKTIEFSVKENDLPTIINQYGDYLFTFSQYSL